MTQTLPLFLSVNSVESVLMCIRSAAAAREVAFTVLYVHIRDRCENRHQSSPSLSLSVQTQVTLLSHAEPL